ncbi:sulfatase-like hydrolase/transferase [Haloarcula nitratireducens]|uniref:Sulfatase-like hydrolase/transferase n=1 Tax=Haloarcula nitratireducens TaxID=2487749 RepID=A0AAW4P9K2_9EURY|nr:sulfatase-like hydrolase/transferase [Halomicroarcula nitratireducens]MBX0294585.1 sulfatase-like hydrolase/transferase [Halomicroarcula nitratireducens]
MTSETPPNVLAVLTDQQRWDTLGAYDSPMDLTPTLDRLAQRGTLVERAISPQPVCRPFRAAFHTGQFATETGVWREGLELGEDRTTLAHRFAEAGYDVGFVGSWHLGGTFDEPVPTENRGGYDDFWRAADVPEFTSKPYEGHLYDEAGERVSFEKYRTDAFTDFAATALDSLSEPFFLVVAYLEPHHQNDMWTFVAPDGYAERYETDPYVPADLENRPGDWFRELPDYYGMVERLDESIGDLLGALETRGLRGDTVVSYTSDHGCHFRTRPGEYKRTPHESAVRVPGILAGPGFEEAGDVGRVTSLIDFPPTLLDAAGLPVPAEMHGDSLLPVARGEEPDEDGDAFVQVSESQVGRALRTDRWKYAVAAPKQTGWRGGNGQPASDTYVERYLFDLHKDPAEQVNLAGRPNYRDVSDRLKKRLLQYIADVEGADPTIKPRERGFPEY